VVINARSVEHFGLIKNMKIKKLDETTTYKQINTSYVFDVNGKRIKASYWEKVDDYFSQYESDYEIDEEDKKLLSEEELEVLEDNLSEAMQLKEEEEIEIEI